MDMYHSVKLHHKHVIKSWKFRSSSTISRNHTFRKCHPGSYVVEKLLLLIATVVAGRLLPDFTGEDRQGNLKYSGVGAYLRTLVSWKQFSLAAFPVFIAFSG